MRYTSAVVLSTLAAGQAAALHNRHASFHERRQAEVKRDIQDVDWSKVAYDLSGVNWSTVKYNLPGQSTPTPTPQPTVAAQPSSKAAPAPASSSAPAVQAQSTSNTASNLVTDITQGLNAIVGSLGLKQAVNSNSNNGAMWIGNDSPWKTTFTNQAGQDLALACWTTNSGGYSAPFLTASAAQILASIPSGKSLTVSFAPNVGSACAPMFAGDALSSAGLIAQTWYEVTFPDGQPGSGGFDISRLPNMNGRNMVAKGSQCTADLNTCSFTCTGEATSCMTGYELNNCQASNGGGGGYNAAAGGVGGGCSMNQSAETVNVSLY